MSTAHSQVLSRVSKILLAGFGVAFAWLVLSLFLGFASSDARADDSGLVDELGFTFTGINSGATAIVEGAGALVVQGVAPVVEQVASAPIQPAAPVARTIAPIVPGVADVAAAGVATPIVSGVTGAVSAVPLVGDASAALGLDGALVAAGASVDALLAGTTGAATDTVTGVLDPLTGLAPGIPPLGSLGGILSPSIAAAHPDAAPQPLDALRAAALTATTAWTTLTYPGARSSLTDSSAATAGGFGGFTLLRSVLQTDSAFTGPGGAGLGAWVLVALGPVVAYRAWMRRSGLENDVAPAAPVLSTDVSPD